MTDNNGITISDITANAAIWAPGEPAVISFKFKNGSGSKILSMRIEIVLMVKDFTGGTSTDTILLTRLVGDEFVMAQVNLANGKSKTYSASFTIPAIAEFYFSENPNIRAVPIYIRYSAGSSYDVFGGTFQIDALKALNHRFSPQITAMNLVRAKDGLPNDEGENVLTTLKLAVDGGGYDYSRFLSAKLYYARGDSATTADTSIDLTGNIADQLPSAENDPNLIPGTYDKAYDWDFLLVFGDEYEAFYGRFNLGMAFANLHLSGVSTGGACFGGFSTSGYGKPKLESYYPGYFYKGINKLGEDWNYLTPLTGTTPAEFGGGQLRCRKVENKCIVEGSLMVKPGSSTLVLAALPDGYTPEKGVFSINACEGGRVARIVVGGDGEENAGKLCVSWVKNLTDGSNYTAAAIWIQCSIEYWVEAPEDDVVSTANLIDSTGAIVTDVTGRQITVRSAGGEPYQSIYTGKQIDDGITAANNAASRTYVDDAISQIELLPGPAGPAGPSGATGATGPAGPSGAAGSPGKSAYEYAQEGGYTGTEEEFGPDLNNAIQGGGGSGGSTAWKDIEGNPFMRPITGSVKIDGDTLRWDGNKDGMVTAKIYGGDCVFVSDNMPTYEKLQVGCDVTVYDPDREMLCTLMPLKFTAYPDVVELRCTFDGDLYYTLAYVALVPNASFRNGQIERAGVYFNQRPFGQDDNYIMEFTLPNYAWTETKEKIAIPIPPIPQDYLPEGYGGVGIVSVSIEEV